MIIPSIDWGSFGSVLKRLAASMHHLLCPSPVLFSAAVWSESLPPLPWPGLAGAPASTSALYSLVHVL